MTVNEGIPLLEWLEQNGAAEINGEKLVALSAVRREIERLQAEVKHSRDTTLTLLVAAVDQYFMADDEYKAIDISQITDAALNRILASYEEAAAVLVARNEEARDLLRGQSRA